MWSSWADGEWTPFPSPSPAALGDPPLCRTERLMRSVLSSRLRNRMDDGLHVGRQFLRQRVRNHTFSCLWMYVQLMPFSAPSPYSMTNAQHIGTNSLDLHYPSPSTSNIHILALRHHLLTRSSNFTQPSPPLPLPKIAPSTKPPPGTGAHSPTGPQSSPPPRSHTSRAPCGRPRPTSSARCVCSP